LAVPLVAAIQYVDTLAALLYVGAYTSRGEARFLDWETLKPVVLSHRGVTVAPTFDCIPWDRAIVAFVQMEVQYLAATRGIGLSSVRSSRPLHDCRREPIDGAEAAVVPNQLYLSFSPQAPRASAMHFERSGAPCATFSHGIACSTQFASKMPAGLSPFSPDVDYALGQIIHLGKKSDERYLGVGWSWPEETHRWTDGAAAFVYLRSADPLPPGAHIRLHAAGAIFPERPRMTATVRINGAIAGEVSLASDPEAFDLAVPHAALGQRFIEIELQPADSRPPSEIGKHTDVRAIGLSVLDLAVVP
jgi:hypothetical protein